MARDVTAVGIPSGTGIRAMGPTEIQMVTGGVGMILGILATVAAFAFLAWQRRDSLAAGWATIAGDVPPAIWGGGALLVVGLGVLWLRPRDYVPGRSFRRYRVSAQTARLQNMVLVLLGLVAAVGSLAAAALFSDPRLNFIAVAGLIVAGYVLVLGRRRAAEVAADPVVVDLMRSQGMLGNREVRATIACRAVLDGKRGEATVAITDDGYVVALGGGLSMTGGFHGFADIVALGIGQSARRGGERAIVLRFSDGRTHVFLFQSFRLRTTELVVAVRALLGAFDGWLERRGPGLVLG
ncbi:MAG: hypothetical protein PHS60_03545 [Zavarzinia sp.]|nr:hypothetical protein [Zavarzinia sp.]